ncbi:MAG: sulfurtransferase TusA family protein, partial [Thermoplasmata archaeon]
MATINVDSRGSACPGPITDLVRAYKKANNGDIIELLATDSGIKADAKA